MRANQTNDIWQRTRLLTKTVKRQIDWEAEGSGEREFWKHEKTRIKRQLLAWERIGITTPDGLMSRLRTLKLKQRSFGVWILGRTHYRKAIRLLFEVLTHDARCRSQAAHALACIGGQKVVRSLAILLKAESQKTEVDAELLEQIGYALSFTFDERATLPLVDVLTSDLPDPVRAQAAEGIANCAPDDKRRREVKLASRECMKALRDKSAEVRFWSAFALGAVGGRSAIPALQRLVDHDKAMCPGWWPVRDEASDAICNILGQEHPERIQ